jgi:hypothetical protein
MNRLETYLRSAFLISAMALTACGGSSGSSVASNVDDTDSEDSSSNEVPQSGSETQAVRMILIGDSGNPGDGAYAVGRAIARVCEVRGCDLVLGLGDNIYESGVDSVLDPQFEEKFEIPFEPVELPFYMVLGNHDNTGFFGGDGAGNAAGDFQVDYHYRDIEHPEAPRMTDRWKMPERYYRFSKGSQTSGAPLVEFFAIDSSQIAGGFPDADENFSYNNYGLVQAQWLKEAVDASQAKWKIVVAHHPYVSNGSHGNAGNYDGVPSFLAPVLAGERYKQFAEETFCDDADFFFTGHDHDLQWLMETEDCGKTEFIVSGAGSKHRSLERRNENPAYYEKGDSYGFFWVEISGDTMVGEAYEVDPDSESLGLGSLTAPQPAYRRSMTQRLAVGLPDSNAFSSPLEMDGEFDLYSESGNLDPVQTQFAAGIATLAENLPDENAAKVLLALGESTNALLEVVDSLINGIQLSATEQNPELAAAGAARAGQALLYALQSLQSAVSSEDGTSLPAPLDQLEGIFANFGSGDGETEAEPGDLTAVTDAVNALALNIQNVVDAIEEETGMVPVLGGAFSLLSELLFDVSRVVDSVGHTDTSELGQVLTSTVDDLLNNLLVKVIPIQEYAPAEVTDAIGMGPAFLSSTLLAVVREVTYQLDNTLIAALAPVINILDSVILTPLLDALAGLNEL